jgi:2-polyprenyl-3-methyl-5-hydroxy-6-metoxy-1,4-benzoquinol methylase
MDNLQQIQDDEYSFPYHYVSQFRNGFTESYFDSWGINYVATIEFILEKLKGEKLESAIDIGCGDGRLVSEIQKNFPSATISGVDYSTRAIQLAKSMNPKGNYRQMDIIAETIEQKFDLAVLMEVFEHIKPEESEKFVASIPKLLNAKGILYVTVPHINKAIEYKHYRHFSSTSLIKCFDKYFDVVEIVPFEQGKKRKAILDTLLGNRFFILNSHRLRTILYNYYKKNLFTSDEQSCNRIFVKFAAK